ncbi:ABC-2 family transporter protein [Clostridium sp.]|uniref:ABC transporter permease n=1 Tax=Clostridium sp. TaxID=1506 RepID=UPI00284E9754|nr:ABC-2 family transporter protein [Clostridium sp.]MDR3595292.1 ABC-2 family transporter protein [Clostridium sp.]
MRAYWSFFKIRFINGLQYRAAAYAGVVTQFAWGFMYIMLYHSFYKGNPSASNMTISELSSYIWLQQSFLALFMTWFLDNDIFEAISSGNVAYEVCRPLNIYNMWFAKSCATRVSKAVLRCFPILIIASFLPETYKFNGPASIYSFILFLVSVILGTIVVVGYSMLIYIFTFFTISSMGVRMTMVMIADFFAGGLVPLPLLPEFITKYIYISPFAAMQNTPFRIYTGGIPGDEAIKAIMLQLFWAMSLILIGKFMMSKAMKKVIVQGG